MLACTTADLLDLSPPPPFPTSSPVSGPLGVLLLKCGLAPGDFCFAAKLGEPPGNCQEARERPESIFPFSNAIALSLYSAGGHMGFLLHKRDY